MSKSSSRKGVVLLAIAFFALANTNARANNNNSGSDSTAVVIAQDKDLLRSEIASFAKEYLGTRYRYAGRTPAGFDCSGFTRYVMSHFDVSLSSCANAQINDGAKVNIKDTKAGDLIFFRRKGRIFHVAMVYENNDEGVFVIHSTYRGVVIDNLSKSKYWHPKAFTARDILGNRELPIEKLLAKRSGELLEKAQQQKKMQEMAQSAFYLVYAAR